MSDVTDGTPCTVAIRGGVLHVEPATGEGAPCLVVLGDGVRLSVNGVVVHERCELHGTEEVVVELGDEPAANLVDVELGERDLEAVVTVRSRPGTRHRMVDQEPTSGLTVWREVDGHPEPDAPAPSEISHALSGHGVTRGVLMREIGRLIAEPYGTSVVVARGTPPGEPVDAVLTHDQRDACAGDPLFTVPAGTLLATKTPAAPGADGESVRGNAVPARAPLDPALVAGAGTVAHTGSDGTVRVYSTVAGRPVYDEEAVAVASHLTLAGDVGVETGDVEVLGSLVVTGGVGEHRRVEATGSVEISGGAARAALRAGGALIVRGPCLHSDMVAGTRAAAWEPLTRCIADALPALRGLASDAAAVHSLAVQRGLDAAFASVIPGVARQRTPEVCDALAEAAEGAARLADRSTEALVADAMVIAGLIHGAERFADVDAAGFAAALDRLEAAVASPPGGDEHPSSQLSYVLTSTLSCVGDLEITGQGVLTSEVTVSGDLTCSGGRSTIRGGTTTVGGVVRAGEIGAGATRTVVDLTGPTATRDRLVATRAHAGVRIEIAGVEIVLAQDRTGLTVGVDETGRVIGG